MSSGAPQFQVEKKWNHVIAIFLVMTFGCWIVFAILWYLICYSHGDLNVDVTGARLSEGVMPCVEGVTTLTGFFLMSFEVQVNFLITFYYLATACLLFRYLMR